MPIQVTMPRLSDTMEQGTVVRWHVKEGGKVSAGDVIADIETDKATMEMQAFDDGVVTRLLIPEGKTVKVGETIAIIAGEGEDASAAAAAPASQAPPPAARPAAPQAPQAPHASHAPQAPQAPHAPVTSTVEPRIVADAEAREAGPARVSPVAKRMAEELGIDATHVRGSGPGGRVVKRDIQSAAENKTAKVQGGGTGVVPAPAQSKAADLVAAAPSSVRQAPNTGAHIGANAGALVQGSQAIEVPVSNMRQIIAKRLIESKTSIPHYQVTMRFAMDAILEMRKQLNEQLAPLEVKLSVNDFIIRACALAMSRNPYFNASWAGDRILVHQQVNIGVAIALDEEKGGGLLVGVIRDTDRKSLRQISHEVRALSEKARTRGLSLEDMTGATFTVSNLGMFGVDNFTAIINPPNSAILACGAAIEQPVVRGHQLQVGWEMNATLSLDHRVIDGAMAAKYLQTLKQAIETPTILLV